MRLLGHVEQDQPHVLVGNGGAHAHVAQHGLHHAGRKLLGRGVTAAAVGVKALFSLHPHGVGIGGVENWGVSRKVISRGGSLYSQVILGLPYHDLTGGFKCFRRRVLETIDLDSVDTKGYGFQIEMTYRAHLLGFKIVELPIIFVDRKVGESKMSNDIVTEAMKNVWKLRFSKLPRRPA